jgi:hypothetical protein
VLSSEDRKTLIWLRFHWGEEYAVNLQGSIWTAVPRLNPEMVLSEPTAARLRAAMYLDAAGRRIRAGATAARWEGESSGARAQPSSASCMGRNFACVSPSSATGSDPATIPHPANRRAVAPVTSAQRSAIPHSPLPRESTQPTGPA